MWQFAVLWESWINLAFNDTANFSYWHMLPPARLLALEDLAEVRRGQRRHRGALALHRRPQPRDLGHVAIEPADDRALGGEGRERELEGL